MTPSKVDQSTSFRSLFTPLSDAPLAQPDRDLLAFRPDLEIIYRAITQDDGAAVGLVVKGPWGSGKTTFCRMLQSLLTTPDYSGVRTAMIDATSIRQPERDVVHGILTAFTRGDTLEAAQLASRFDLSHGTAFGALNRWLAKRLEDARGENKHDRLLLIIDDVDRADDDIVRGILTALRPFLSHSSTSILLSIKDGYNLAARLPEGSSEGAIDKYIRFTLPLRKLRNLGTTGLRALFNTFRRLHPDTVTYLGPPQQLNQLDRNELIAQAKPTGGILLDFGGAVELIDGRRSADELLLATLSPTLTLRTYKRMVSRLLYLLAVDADRHFNLENTTRTQLSNRKPFWLGLYHYQMESHWFPDARLKLFREPQTTVGQEITDWKRCQVERTLETALEHFWPALWPLRQDNTASFRRVLLTMKMTWDSSADFDGGERREAIRGSLPEGINIPPDITLRALSSLVAELLRLETGILPEESTELLTAHEEINPLQQLVRAPLDGGESNTKEPALTTDPTSPPPSQAGPAKAPEFASTLARQVRDTFDSIDTVSEAELAMGIMEAASNNLTQDELRWLIPHVEKLVQRHDTDNISLHAGNISVDLERKRLHEEAYALYRIQKERGKFEPPEERNFRLCSQYISFLQDAEGFEAPADDASLMGRTAVEEARYWLDRWEPFIQELPYQLRLRFTRLSAEFQKDPIGLAESMLEGAQDLELSASIAIITLLSEGPHVPIGLQMRVIEAAEANTVSTVKRAIADMLASSREEIDERTAIALYFDIEPAGLPAWDAGARHNAATLLMKHNRGQAVAFELWKEALQMEPQSHSIRSAFSQLLSRARLAAAAVAIQRGEPLPPNLSYPGDSNYDPRTDPWYLSQRIEVRSGRKS